MEDENKEVKKKKNEGTINFSIKKDNLWKYSTFILAGILIIGAFITIGGNDSPGTGAAVGAGAAAPTREAPSIDDDAVLGNPNAPVTIIEFSDYQCPFCRKFWGETFQILKTDYIDTGKVKLIFRDFPLTSIHPMALPSAEAAECVKEQGGDEAYFKYHDKMFSEQNILDSGSPNGPVTKTAQYTNTDLVRWASEIGYDMGSCLSSGKMRSEVQDDLKDGVAAGVQGTPAFFVNDQFLSGAQPLSAFQQAIEAEL